MKSRTPLEYRFLLVISDFLTIIAAFVAAYVLRVSFDARPLIDQIPSVTYLRIFLLLVPFWLIIFAGLGLYKREVFENRVRELLRLLLGSFIGILFIIGYDFVVDEPIFPARLVALYGFLLGFGLLALVRQLMWQLRKYGFRHGYGVQNVMLIGNAPATKDLTRMLSNTTSSGYKVVAIVGAKSQLPDGFKGTHYSNLNDALESVSKHAVDAIVQTQLYESSERNKKIQQAAQTSHIDYKLMLAESDFYSGAIKVELFHYFPVIAVHPTPLLGWGRIAKRLFDAFFGLLLVIVFSPVMVLIVVAMKLFDRGPILFKQKRLTRGGAEVDIFKFRTMKTKYSGVDPKKVFTELGKPELYEELINNRGKVVNDPRVTRLGRFLRDYSLDELPQLFNVLSGSISLVGPRTILKSEAEQSFRDKTPLLLSVKTGLTGLAQVSGRSDIPMEERIRLDLYYVQNWSLWMDIKILFKTIGTVLSRKGSE